jgi:hypothetical protein
MLEDALGNQERSTVENNHNFSRFVSLSTTFASVQPLGHSLATGGSKRPRWCGWTGSDRPGCYYLQSQCAAQHQVSFGVLAQFRLIHDWINVVKVSCIGSVHFDVHKAARLTCPMASTYRYRFVVTTLDYDIFCDCFKDLTHIRG